MIDGDDGSDAGDTTLTNKSDLSFLSDEGLEVSQNVITDSLFQGPSLDEQGEELVIDSRGRLKTAVDKLLEMVTLLTRQVRLWCECWCWFSVLLVYVLSGEFEGDIALL